MSAAKTRFPRHEALTVARELCAILKPVSERLIVAGSLRRRKAEVGDIEILYIPRMEERRIDLLTSTPMSLAHDAINAMLASGILSKRPSVTGSTSWGISNRLALHRSGLPVDFFSASEGNWYNYLVCRTGPAASNIRIAAAAQNMGYKWHPYGRGFEHLDTGKGFPMKSEKAVFDFVNLPYAEPWDRH